MSEQNDCIFCMIVEGKLPSSKVYETENLYAFLDLNPVHEGHTLIIPKKHCENIFDADPAIGEDVIKAMQRVGEALKKVTGCTGVNVLQNNGRTAKNRCSGKTLRRTRGKSSRRCGKSSRRKSSCGSGEKGG